MNKRVIGLIILSSGLLMSCSDNNEEIKSSTVKNSTSPLEIKKVERDVDPVQYSKGYRLFQLNCAVCHGQNGEGAENWRQPDDSGKNPAPPLNGTGHTWHHSEKGLTNTIRNGTAKIGGNMPAWKNKLADDEIKLILTWIKAQWPDELYYAWYNRFH